MPAGSWLRQLLGQRRYALPFHRTPVVTAPFPDPQRCLLVADGALVPEHVQDDVPSCLREQPAVGALASSPLLRHFRFPKKT